MYIMTLIITTIVVVIGGALSFALSDGQVPLLAFITPILFFTYPNQLAFLFICIGLLGFGFSSPYQPVSLSISLWMLVPVLVLVTSQKRNWQVSVLVLSVVAAMGGGVLALQSDQKIDGEAYHTFFQLASVFMIWLGAYFWKPVSKPLYWPLLLIGLIFISSSVYAGLFSICVSILIFCLQEISLKDQASIKAEKLCVTLPSLGFATLILIPQVNVPNAILVAWLLSLTITWLGDYLINAEIMKD